MKEWVIGVVLNLGGSVVINLGTNLMKLSHNKKAAAEAKEQELPMQIAVTCASPPAPQGGGDGSPRRSFENRAIGWAIRKLWPIGAALLALGSVVTFVSFSFAAQSLLAGLSSIQFVSNVFFVRLVLGEQVTSRTIGGTMLIVAGQALIIIYSPHASKSYTVPELQGLYIEPVFLGYLAAKLGGAGLLGALYHVYTDREGQHSPLPGSRLVRPSSYAMLSALIGTLSVLQAKCLSELLRSSIRGNNQLTYPFTYAVLLLWLSATAFWLYRMNLGLKLFDGVFIIPVLQVFWTFFAILDGFIFFEEYKKYTSALPLLGFISGVLIVFVGVYLLCPRPKREPTVGLEEEEGGSPGILHLGAMAVAHRTLSWCDLKCPRSP